MLQGALYIRVSTDEQIEYSPDAQKKALLDYAKKNKILVSPENIFIDEGYSGRRAEKRPAFMRMIGLAKTKPKPFDVILIHKTDRFARNREDSVVYKSLLRKECGIRVISITEQIDDDKFSIILESMLEAMAEYYSLNLAEEVKKGLTEKAKRGEHSGTAPLGYLKPESGSKILRVDEKYREIIIMIFSKFVDEDMSMLEISRQLNALGYKTKNNADFSKRTIRYVLENPIYAGYSRWNYRKGNQSVFNDPDEWIIEQGEHEAIISKELYDKAQQKLNKIKAVFPSRRRPASDRKRHWLSGIAKCQKCGGALAAIMKNGYVNYRCSRHAKGTCDTPNYISARKLETAVLETIKEDLEHISDVSVEKIRTSQQVSELDMLQSQLEKVQKKYDLAQRAFLAEIDSLDDYKKNKERIQKEEEALLERINQIHNESLEMNSDSRTEMIFRNAYELLCSDDLDVNEKFKIATSFIKYLSVNAKEKDIEIEYYIDE